MRPSPKRAAASALFTFGLILLGAAADLGAAEFSRDFDLKGEELHLANLIGEVTLLQGSRDTYEVTVAVRGDDAEEDLIDFEVKQGGKARLVIGFPVEEHRHYVYPALGRNGKCSFAPYAKQGLDRSWVKEVLRALTGRKIKVTGRGSGLEMWADVTVKVPRDGKVAIGNGAGKIVAADLDAKLTLAINCGPVEAYDISGDLSADTGSGSIIAERISGAINADTGSGSVTLTACKGAEITVDTGSGSVHAKDLTCERLNVDTGSGSIEAIGVATDRAKLDTGSGGVKLQLDRMGNGRFVIDTGSGSISLGLPDDASATITADTGSGAVTADLPGAEIEHSERNHLVCQVGEGEARVTLDAGSGSIKISQ